MSERTIKKLKNRFVLLSMLSFVAVMLFMGALIFVANLAVTRQEISLVLDYIIENNGDLPQLMGDGDDEERTPSEVLFRISRDYESPEFSFMTRYFAVLYDNKGQVDDVKVGYIAAVTNDNAVEMADMVKDRVRRFGSYKNYYYKVRKRKDRTKIVVFLDSSNRIRTNNRILYFALWLIGLGMIISFMLLRLLSNRVVRSEIRNAELQKQFLTNASHELKTPLAVIRANTEILEMSGGENEWTKSTMRQIERMDGLIKNLLMITRAQEQDDSGDRKDTDISKAVRETAETFDALASQSGKNLSLSIQEGVHMKAQEGQIRQLTSLLTDNAIKYCDEGGDIRVVLARKGRGMHLEVHNSFKDGEGVDCDRFFDRFYREDASHNIEQGGYGIGLSIADSIVRQYRGSIKASWEKGVISFICEMQ